jgi:hypothetical protein
MLLVALIPAVPGHDVPVLMCRSSFQCRLRELRGGLAYCWAPPSAQQVGSALPIAGVTVTTGECPPHSAA